MSTHNGRYTRLYNIWSKMKQRCYDKNHTYYNRYGGRGIVVCDEWKNDFTTFRKWAYENGYTDNLTIDRVNNNGNYEPTNCRWITLQDQCNNRSTTRLLTFNNQTHSIAEWARIYGTSRNVIWYRLKQGWSVEKTLTTPFVKYKKDR